MAANRSGPDHERENAEILAGLDVRACYEALGVRFASKQARSSGMIECYAASRDESRPSACVNLKTGRYIDKGGANENLSIWDFAAQYGSFQDWQAARRHYAELAGVELAGKKKHKSGGAREESLDSLRFLDWTPGRHDIVRVWARKWKPGCSLEAVLRAGGLFGEYPCWKDKTTGEPRGGEFRVLALPCWGPDPPPAEPVCYVLFNATGPTLPVWRGPDIPRDWVKMKTVGPSRGAMMNRHALERLAAGLPCDRVIKSGGPTDMLALLTAQPPDRQDLDLVVTNASGEGGDVLPHQVALFRDRHTLLIHDRDTAGLVGAGKWLAALADHATSTRVIRLPYGLRPKGGRDTRDFLNGIQEDGT